MIYLRPKLPEEIQYAQEALAGSLEEWEVKFKRRGKKFYETVLPIARPKRDGHLQEGHFNCKKRFYIPDIIVCKWYCGF